MRVSISSIKWHQINRKNRCKLWIFPSNTCDEDKSQIILSFIIHCNFANRTILPATRKTFDDLCLKKLTIHIIKLAQLNIVCTDISEWHCILIVIYLRSTCAIWKKFEEHLTDLRKHEAKSLGVWTKYKIQHCQ
jgi:hypothetical protein